MTGNLKPASAGDVLTKPPAPSVDEAFKELQKLYGRVQWKYYRPYLERFLTLAAQPSPSVERRVEIAPVERIECVSYESGYKEPAEPLWRVDIGGYCADFSTETAANNFRSAILALLAQPATGAEEGR